jgi:prevent-host-death family protein
MSKSVPETQTMKISDVKISLSSLVNEVYRQQTRIVVEKAGIPVAALVSIEDLARLKRLDEERAERRRVLEAMRAPFRGIPFEEIEREADKAIAEVRAERRAEREASVKSA